MPPKSPPPLPFPVAEDRQTTRRSIVCNILQKPRNPVNRPLPSIKYIDLSYILPGNWRLGPTKKPHMTFCPFFQLQSNAFVCSNFHNEAWIIAAQPREPNGR